MIKGIPFNCAQTVKEKWEVIAYIVLKVAVLTRAWCRHAHEKLAGYSFAVVSPGFHV
jgi:hypothetical protein